MCCESKGHHGSQHRHRGHHHGGSCCCGGHSCFGPGFWTRAEKVAWLEQVLEGLREEVQAVEERIAALKGEE
jgi:hypothetical protein